MKKTALFLILAVVFLNVAIAAAESIHGEVVSISPDLSGLTIRNDKGATPAEKEMQILVDKKTKLKGLTNLTELAKGDEVVVDVSKSKNGLEAKSLEVDKVKLHQGNIK